MQKQKDLDGLIDGTPQFEIYQFKKVFEMELNATFFEFILENRIHQSFFDLNHNQEEKSLNLNAVENAIDSLETAASFLDRDDKLKWKWIAIALHHSLYSFCIACLVNSNFENVLTTGKNIDENNFLLQGNCKTWKQSKKRHKTRSGGYTIEWIDIDNDPTTTSPEKQKNLSGVGKPKLIGFWTAIARVQDQTFWMGRLMGMKALVLNDSEWKNIEWLTDYIRNGIVHFVPKYISISIVDIEKACIDVIRAIEFLAEKSYAIIYHEPEKDQIRIKQTIKEFRSKILI